MALTDAQVAAVRRHAGVPIGVSAEGSLVEAALDGMDPPEEAVLLATWLPRLDALETGLLAAGDSMDTAKAAVWERNPNELVERWALYRHVRIGFCRWLGLPAVAVAVNDPPPAFSSCCPRPTTGTGSGSGGTVDPVTGLAPIPAVFVV